MKRLGWVLWPLLYFIVHSPRRHIKGDVTRPTMTEYFPVLFDAALHINVTILVYNIQELLFIYETDIFHC